MERWLIVSDTSGLYEVSSSGMVRRVGGKTLKPDRMPEGYAEVTLSVHGKRLRRRVGRLVLAAFDRAPQEAEQCRHMDGDCRNDDISNLAWGLAQDNEQDKKLHGTYNHIGEAGTRAKLSESDVLEMLTLLNGGQPGASVARKFGVSQPMVSKIKLRRSWSHL